MSILNVLKKNFFGVFVAMLTFLVLTVVYLKTPLLDLAETGTVNFRFYLRDPMQDTNQIQAGVTTYTPNPRAREDIVILGIDLNTIRSFTQENVFWPFPWNVHAKFVSYVASGNPKAIFFDIMFVDHKPFEKELADAIRKAGNVYVDYAFEEEKKHTKVPDLAERMEALARFRLPLDPKDASPTWPGEIEPPTPLIANAARGVGFANVKPDPDHVNRTMPLLIKHEGHYYPNPDLLIVMDYFGIGAKDVEIRMGKHIRLKNLPAEKMAKPNAAREIVIPIDETGRMDINFIGAHGSFKNYPYYYFHRGGTMDNKSLEKKIVLVAAYAATGVASDMHGSPYGTLYGIEHHASAINTILNQDFIVKLAAWQNLLIMLAIALLLGLLLTRLSIIKSTVLTVVLIAGYAVAGYLFFEFRNVIVAYATPIIQMATTFTFIIVYRVLTEQKEKKFIKQTFSKFVSHSVVEELLQDPERLKLGGDKKNLTVLFSDIRGFTTISERLTPEALVVHLNEYLQEMTDVVFKYDGTLDKYVGDEIMAFWGAPIPQEDHALRACRTALEMMTRLRELNENWKSQGKPPLDIGIGINTGEMVVGFMGSSSRMDYTLMGDMVNLGARLEGTNKAYGTNIIISEFTYEHVRDHVIVRELDLVRVKGKLKPVKIYELFEMK
ncbi:MAG TPA: adenylate/guanylate cyclase domain-containing protein [Spirochaetota bacterium]|nr:adenylate/guanylate cyclase domain-containing protein [Spirochaetota bacterium]HPU89612.1 adenylate/guanylate cyclase domain-containing protein [Spirochaetota bacterium]